MRRPCVIAAPRQRSSRRRRSEPRAALLLLAVLLAGCAPSGEESEFLARRAELQRQTQGIRELITEAEHGSLVPADRFLIGVDEKVVGELLRSQLPFDLPLGNSFVVRVSDATVQLRDKFGRFRLKGEIHRLATPERRTGVEVTGSVGAVRIDAGTGLLTMNVTLDHLEFENPGPLEHVLGPGGRKFLGEPVRGLLQQAMPPLQIPVAFTQVLRLPAIHDGAVQLDSLVVPLGLSVERVLAVEGKLWVTLHAAIGQVNTAGNGLGIHVKLEPGRSGTSSRPAPKAPAQAAPESSRGAKPRGES
jgi:hypothetical protein